MAANGMSLFLNGFNGLIDDLLNRRSDGFIDDLMNRLTQKYDQDCVIFFIMALDGYGRGNVEDDPFRAPPETLCFTIFILIGS